MNPLAEAWGQRPKHEVLNHFIVFGEKHLRLLLKECLCYYHTARPHQGLGNVPIGTALPPPEPMGAFRVEEVVCHESLGGLLKYYERKSPEAPGGEPGRNAWLAVVAFLRTTGRATHHAALPRRG
jgi:putative transposase